MGYAVAILIGGCVSGLIWINEREAKAKTAKAKARRIEQCGCRSHHHA